MIFIQHILNNRVSHFPCHVTAGQQAHSFQSKVTFDTFQPTQTFPQWHPSILRRPRPGLPDSGNSNQKSENNGNTQ